MNIIITGSNGWDVSEEEFEEREEKRPPVSAAF
jgi:hypothetical protein